MKKIKKLLNLEKEEEEIKKYIYLLNVININYSYIAQWQNQFQL